MGVEKREPCGLPGKIRSDKYPPSPFPAQTTATLPRLNFVVVSLITSGSVKVGDADAGDEATGYQAQVGGVQEPLLAVTESILNLFTRSLRGKQT